MVAFHQLPAQKNRVITAEMSSYNQHANYPSPNPNN